MFCPRSQISPGSIAKKVRDRELNHNCTPVGMVSVHSDDDVGLSDLVSENSFEDIESGSYDSN